jgi:capsular polysaccharide biosynthesis protein
LNRFQIRLTNINLLHISKKTIGFNVLHPKILDTLAQVRLIRMAAINAQHIPGTHEPGGFRGDGSNIRLSG